MRRFANFCIAVGASVAVLGVLGVALGFRPSALPPALLDVAAFKLVFIAAGGLVIAGAVLGRAARGRSAPETPPVSDAEGRQLQPGASDIGARTGEPVYERTHHTP
jgi:hypothetical protein